MDFRPVCLFVAFFAAQLHAQEVPAVTGASPPPKWSKGLSEYNIPKSVYIPGDPILLSKENMNSGQHISFVACPIYQDSDPTPLWLAEAGGETYFLRAQQNLTGDVHHPQLLHKLLVEGILSKEERVGGGLVLTPLNLSVLPEVEVGCNEVRPKMAGLKVAFAKRPPGPGSDGSHRETINQSMREERARLDAPTYPVTQVAAEPREFVVPFDFNDEMVWGYAVVTSAVKYARSVNAQSIEISASRGAALLSDGSVIVEDENIAKLRLDAVTAIITDYPISKAIVHGTWDAKAQTPDGISDFANRFVRIRILPAGQSKLVAGK